MPITRTYHAADPRPWPWIYGGKMVLDSSAGRSVHANPPLAGPDPRHARTRPAGGFQRSGKARAAEEARHRESPRRTHLHGGADIGRAPG